MSEMKRRIRLAEEVIAQYPEMGRSKMTDHEGFCFESVCLQIRKILELVAFSGMIANGLDYSQKNQDFLAHEKASKIVKNLDRLNKSWFPEHVAIHLAGGQIFVEPTASAFNRDLWIEVYDKMGEILHIHNPFAGPPKIHMKKSIPDTLAIIKRHMQAHRVLLAADRAYVCKLGSRTGRVDVFEGIIPPK